MRVTSKTRLLGLAVLLVPRAAEAAGISAEDKRDRIGERFEQACAPGFALAGVWGTEVYTDDSDICTAAVHAGLITQAGGGTVTYEMRPAQDAYDGSERNGIETAPWGHWYGSYVFVGGTPGGGTPGPALRCGLGEHWDVVDTDGAWTGVWVPTGAASLDGTWARQGEPEFRAPLTFAIGPDGRVSLYRDDPEPNKYTTTDCQYEGQLQSDGVTIHGTVTCNSGVGVLGPFGWSATIACGKSGGT